MTKNNLIVPRTTKINSTDLLASDNIVSFPDKKSKERNNMTQENVSFRDLAKLEADFERKIEHNNQLLDAKLENLNQKIDSKFDLITQKIEDGFKLQKVENEKYFKEELADQKDKITNRLGLYVMIATLVVTVAIPLIQKIF